MQTNRVVNLAQIPLCPENLTLLASGSSRNGLPACPISREVAVFMAADMVDTVARNSQDAGAEDRQFWAEYGAERLQGAAVLAELCGSDAAIVEFLKRVGLELLAKADAIVAEQQAEEFALGREDRHG